MCMCVNAFFCVLRSIRKPVYSVSSGPRKRFFDFTSKVKKFLNGKNDKSLPPMSKVKFRNSWRFFEASTIFINNFWHLVFWQTRFFTFFFKLEQVLLWGAIYPASMIDRKILASAYIACLINVCLKPVVTVLLPQ